jgi:hypothetical protein
MSECYPSSVANKDSVSRHALDSLKYRVDRRTLGPTCEVRAGERELLARAAKLPPNRKPPKQANWSYADATVQPVEVKTGTKSRQERRMRSHLPPYLLLIIGFIAISAAIFLHVRAERGPDFMAGSTARRNRNGLVASRVVFPLWCWCDWLFLVFG